jgi:hypothetical protein
MKLWSVLLSRIVSQTLGIGTLSLLVVSNQQFLPRYESANVPFYDVATWHACEGK